MSQFASHRARASFPEGQQRQRLGRNPPWQVEGIESGQQIVVGVNRWTETEPSPLSAGEGSILVIDPKVEAEQVESLKAWRAARDAKAVKTALAELEQAAKEGRNIMEPSIAAARAGVTTGEWGGALRRIFGEYRAPTGVAQSAVARDSAALDSVRASVDELSGKLGRRVKFLVGKPGLDGHSNGAEQIAVRARDVGMEVVYEGIRLTPGEIVQSARDEGVHVIGLSILSGSHGVLVLDVLDGLRKSGLEDVPVVVGGIVPDADAEALRRAGVKRVYTPKDFDLTRIMGEIVDVVAESPAVH